MGHSMELSPFCPQGEWAASGACASPEGDSWGQVDLWLGLGWGCKVLERACLC